MFSFIFLAFFRDHPTGTRTFNLSVLSPINDGAVVSTTRVRVYQILCNIKVEGKQWLDIIIIIIIFTRKTCLQRCIPCPIGTRVCVPKKREYRLSILM